MQRHRRLVLLLYLIASSLHAAPTPSPTPVSGSPVILFLVDNSASLPPLDPQEKRVTALEKIFSFLRGQQYRLVLFGGRREIFVDDVSRYRNTGQWTDFYFAFAKARELMATYPRATEFRLVLITDGLLDPSPADWRDMGVPQGEDLKAHTLRRTLALLRELQQPLYVVLVGDVPAEGLAVQDREQTPLLILDMVQAANGTRATPLAQSVASFFEDDGLLLKKFIFRVAPEEGLKKIEPAVRRIVAPSAPVVEVQFLTVLVLPLTLFVLLLLGILVRSFPGPGDLEILELKTGTPVHVAADRLHKLESGGWAPTGLSLATDARDASATFTHQAPPVDLAGVGLNTDGLDPLTLRLLPLGLEQLKRSMEGLSNAGTKEEKIFALNLDYMAKNFDAAQAEQVLASSPLERRRISPLDFLRAKVHLLSNADLRRKLTEPRVQVVAYGRGGERKDLPPGATIRIGGYRFIVKDVGRGGRKDVRVVLSYDRVPSLLGLKTILPDLLQRAVRLRRSSERLVS